MIYLQVAGLLWVGWLVTWWAAALWRDKPAAEAPRRQWRGFFFLIAAGFMLIGIERPGWSRLWTVGPVLGWSMVALVAAGVALMWWARLTMGRMWSGGVLRTESHRVIQNGPFAWVRHPIYTGLIAAAVAFAVLRATPAALAGAALVALGFYLKARVEERFLTHELAGYPEYRERVPMLVPLPRP